MVPAEPPINVFEGSSPGLAEAGSDTGKAPVDLDQSQSLGPRPRWARILWALGGLAFVAIGAVGIVVPGLPTTPLLLLAAACFARSSPRLYRWLLANKTFGPLIADYRAGRGVSRRVKVSALTVMAIFVTFAILVPLRDKPIPSAVVALAAAGGAAFILRIPTRLPQ